MPDASADALAAHLLGVHPRAPDREGLARLPAPVARLLAFRLDERVRAEALPPASPWYDAEDAHVQAAARAFAEAAHAAARFPPAAWEPALRAASGLAVGYLVYPAETAAGFVFEDAYGVRAVPDVLARIEAFEAYPYLREIAARYAERRGLGRLDRTGLERLLRGIDVRMAAGFGPADWQGVLAPLFELVGSLPGRGGRLPASLVARFFQARSRDDLAALFERLDAPTTLSPDDLARRLADALAVPPPAAPEAPPEVDAEALPEARSFVPDPEPDVVEETGSEAVFQPGPEAPVAPGHALAEPTAGPEADAPQAGPPGSPPGFQPSDPSPQPSATPDAEPLVYPPLPEPSEAALLPPEASPPRVPERTDRYAEDVGTPPPPAARIPEVFDLPPSFPPEPFSFPPLPLPPVPSEPAEVVEPRVVLPRTPPAAPPLGGPSPEPSVPGVSEPEGSGPEVSRPQGLRNEPGTPEASAPEPSRLPPPSPPAASPGPEADDEPLWMRLARAREAPPALPDPAAEKPLWMRFADPRIADLPAPPDDAPAPPPDPLHDVEGRVLGAGAAARRGWYVEALFAGDEGAYERTLGHLDGARDWTEATQVLGRFFRDFHVNIYSDPAVAFTDAVEAGFRPRH